MNKLFGITGSISVGKSTVSKFFRELGVHIVDADIVSREVVTPGEYGNVVITNHFGPEYRLPDGNLDRVKLGQFVFSNAEALKKLNSIMLPLIQRRVQDAIELLFNNNNDIVVAYDAALLIESGSVEQFRPLVVVTCPYETQLTRLMERNKLSEEDARNRISKQFSSVEKAKYADFIIDSSGTLEETKQQVLKTYNKITLGQ